MANSEINDVLAVWQPYVASIKDWEALVTGIEPKEGGCGLVYELPNPIEGRPNESFAIADMRNLDISEPHKHINGETEIYIVISGVGKIAVGNNMSPLTPGTTIVTPPDTMHCTLPDEGLVLAVINTPPFNIDNYVSLNENDRAVAETLVLLRA